MYFEKSNDIDYLQLSGTQSLLKAYQQQNSKISTYFSTVFFSMEFNMGYGITLLVVFVAFFLIPSSFII